MSPKSKSELAAENKYLRQKRFSDGIVSIVNNLIKWGGAVLIFRYAASTINSLAGQHTYSNIMVKLVTDMNINEWLAYSLAAGGVVYGKSQNTLRKRTIKELSERSADLERRIDPGRSTSGLTPFGDTHPEDMT